jgi:hypothetical protein
MRAFLLQKLFPRGEMAEDESYLLNRKDKHAVVINETQKI